MPPADPREWAVDLHAWRVTFALSVAEAAKLLPTTERTWRRWEAGEREPPAYLLRALRDVERELARPWVRR